MQSNSRTSCNKLPSTIVLKDSRKVESKNHPDLSDNKKDREKNDSMVRT